MKRETKTIDTHIYFPANLFAALKALAARNRRSMTAEVVIALEERVARDLQAKPGPKGKRT